MHALTAPPHRFAAKCIEALEEGDEEQLEFLSDEVRKIGEVMRQNLEGEYCLHFRCACRIQVHG